MLKIRNESTTLLSLDPLLNFLLKYIKSLSYLKNTPKMTENALHIVHSYIQRYILILALYQELSKAMRMYCLTRQIKSWLWEFLFYWEYR